MRVGVVVAGAAVVAVTIVVASAAREGEPNVLLSITDAATVERDAGERAVVFTVRASRTPGARATVAFATSNGTASARRDYAASAGTLTFDQSTSTRTVAVGSSATRSTSSTRRSGSRCRGRAGRRSPTRLRSARSATTTGHHSRACGSRPQGTSPATRGATPSRRAGRRSRVPPARNLEPPRPRTLRRRARPRRPPVRGCDAGEVRRLLRTVVGAGEVDHAAGSRQPRVPNGRGGGLLPVLRRRGRRPGEGVLQLRPRRVARRRAELELRGGRGCGPARRRSAGSADLAANPATCTLAYWHHPRFSSGEHGSDSTYTAFWQALYEANADVVLVGHDHGYERFAPQRADGALDLVRGIREFVVGTGGRSVHVSEGSTEQPSGT